MVNSTYALRDSSKINSQQYNNQTNNNDGSIEKTHTTNLRKEKGNTKPRTRTLYSLSDFYTVNDPQYHQYKVVVAAPSASSSSKNRRMTKNTRRKKSTSKKKGASASSYSTLNTASTTTTTGSTHTNTCDTSSALPAHRHSQTNFHLHSEETFRIRTPNQNDVLCGRGGNVNNHSGNIYFRSIVSEEKRNYNLTANKTEKSVICQTVIDRIHELEPKGRFLKKESGEEYWVEVEHAKAMAKTSQALREGAPNIRAMATTNATTSATATSTSTRSSKRGRKPKSLLGKRKRYSKYERRSSTRSVDYKDSYEEKDMEEDDDDDVASHPLIVPMSNGHRGKQLIARPEEDDMRDATQATLDDADETEETADAKAERVKKLKLLMHPRTTKPQPPVAVSSIPATPQQQQPSPPLPPLPQAHRSPPPRMHPVSSSSASSNTDSKNLIPSLPNPARVVSKPSSSFFRAHSLATSEEINGSESFIPDEHFVNPFQNETGVFGMGAESANVEPNTTTTTTTTTTAMTGGIEKNVSTNISPTSTAVNADAINCSEMGVDSLIGKNHSPLMKIGNSRSSAEDESNVVFQTTMIGKAERVPDEGKKSSSDCSQSSTTDFPLLLDDDYSCTYDVPQSPNHKDFKSSAQPVLNFALSPHGFELE